MWLRCCKTDFVTVEQSQGAVLSFGLWAKLTCRCSFMFTMQGREWYQSCLLTLREKVNKFSKCWIIPLNSFMCAEMRPRENKSSQLLKLNELLNSVWFQSSDTHQGLWVARPAWLNACHHPQSGGGGGQSLVITAMNPLLWDDKQPVAYDVIYIIHTHICDT